jgi:hypothetical protein
MSTYEHVCGACGRPDTPRVWRRGDSDPGEGVTAVLDHKGYLWSRGRVTKKWTCTHKRNMPWSGLVRYGPLTEVMLPTPVLP